MLPGIELITIETNVEQGVREAMLSPHVPGVAYVQLLEPLHDDTPVGRFLARRGEGLHHLAYAVDDIEKALQSLAAQGIRLIDQHPRTGSMGPPIAFAHPSDTCGVLTELVQALSA